MNERREPFPAYQFTLEIFGESISYPFRRCSGLRDESTVVEVQEGGRETPRKLVGETKYPNIVLKRGFCSATSELYKLRRSIVDFRPSGQQPGKGYQTPRRFSGVITQLGPHDRRARWRFVQAWICKWEGPDFDASKNDISIESIEVAHEGLALLSEPTTGERR